jgi:hypothetical protein
MVILNENAGGGEQYTAIIGCYTSHDTTAVSNAGITALPPYQVFLVPRKRYTERLSPHLEELARQYSQYNDWITREVALIHSRDGYFSLPCCSD